MTNQLYVLLEDGAVDPDLGDRYGSKGQVVRRDSDSLYTLVNPRKSQPETNFYLDSRRLKKI